MRIAIIDIGTNAVRLEIYEALATQAPQLLHQDRRVLRLGNGLYLSGRLNPEAKEPTLQCFREFRQAITAFEAEVVHAVGTSALREAEDGQQLVAAISQDSGFTIETISGADEARLIAKGILANEHERTIGRYALIDVGGGSTEFSICCDCSIEFSTSIPLGAIRCQQRILEHAPPAQEKIAELRTLAEKEFAVIKEQLPSDGLEFAIGSSGTARAFSDLGFSQGADFRSELQNFIERIQNLSTSDVLAIPGMKESRADIILAGALLLETAMSVLQVDNLHVSRFSLRHGLLIEAIEIR